MRDALTASGMPVHFIERTVYDLIAAHVGHANPISLEKICHITGFSDRGVKKAVAELVTDHKILIGASRQEPIGYFMIESEEDRAIAAEPYKGQILQMLRRLRVINGQRRVAEWLGQQVLIED